MNHHYLPHNSQAPPFSTPEAILAAKVSQSTRMCRERCCLFGVQNQNNTWAFFPRPLAHTPWPEPDWRSPETHKAVIPLYWQQKVAFLWPQIQQNNDFGWNGIKHEGGKGFHVCLPEKSTQSLFSSSWNLKWTMFLLYLFARVNAESHQWHWQHNVYSMEVFFQQIQQGTTIFISKRKASFRSQRPLWTEAQWVLGEMKLCYQELHFCEKNKFCLPPKYMLFLFEGVFILQKLKRLCCKEIMHYYSWKLLFHAFSLMTKALKGDIHSHIFWERNKSPLYALKFLSFSSKVLSNCVELFGTDNRRKILCVQNTTFFIFSRVFVTKSLK